MTIDISNNDPRISYSVAQGVTQTSFAIPFEFFDDSDVNVYVDGTLKTITTDYTISGGAGSTGTLSISVTGATGGSTVVLTRDITIERTTDFTAGADINRAALNTQLDTLTGIAADIKDATTLALRYNDQTVGVTTQLPVVDDLKGKTLAFNSSTGAPEAGPTISEVSNAQTYATNASTSATAAASSASAASTSATSASSSASAAATSATAAAASETAAGTSETNAATSATSAASSASSASSSASSASSSASAASTSETNAATSETNAATSATSAASSASSASTSATNAATSETNAANSATSASTSASNAATSATNAATSETNAATSETNAATSETNAATSATNAATSETNAATSASNASTSETNAANSATAAASSATSAASAQAAAESARDTTLAAYDSFDDRYLGTKTSDPTLDNDGNALVAGALYFNSTDGTMKVYTGSAWVAAYVSGTGFLALSGGTMTGDLNFGDSVKANFGAGSDLQIYHDGSHSYILDNGTGNLRILAQTFQLRNSANSENMIAATPDGEVTLFYDNAAKLATTSTGVDVTGTVTADKAVLSASASNNPSLVFEGSSTNVDFNISHYSDASGTITRLGANSYLDTVGNPQVQDTNEPSAFISLDGRGDGDVKIGTSTTGTPKDRLLIDGGTGDISFYEDTGTTAKFFWDASAEALGIGTTSPTDKFHIDGASSFIKVNRTDGEAGITLMYNGSNSTRSNIATQTNGDLTIDTANTERMRIDSSGNVGIGGTANSLSKLHVLDDDPIITLTDTNGVTDKKSWDIRVVGASGAEGLYFRQVNDAYSSRTDEFLFQHDGDFHADGDVIAYSTTISDPRLKTDIQKIEGALDKLCTLSGYTFTYTPDNTASAGILSTEVAAVLPSAIRPKKLPLKTGDDETVYDTVQYDQLHGLLIEAIKELREEVADLKAKIEG